MKTLLIDLFSIASAPNLCLPGGVVDQLSKKTDLRLVYLIPDSDEYARMIKPYLNERTRVETIKKTTPDTFWRKAFHFLHSFLIFTPTTRLLATFGARADAPPAGGNRHLAFVKSFIAATFGRSRWIKLKLVPFIYERLYPERPYRPLFEKYRPDLVFVPNLAFNPSQELAGEARRQGVLSVGMAANWDHLNKYYIPIHTDYLVVQNEPMKEEAVGWHLYQPEQIQVVGFPQFDYYAEPGKYVYPKEQFLKEFNLPADHKIILHISGSVYAPNEGEILEEVVGWIKSGRFGHKVKLLVRPYLGLRDRKLEEEKFAKILHDPNVSFNWERQADSAENRRRYVSMLYWADVVISVFSTTAIESAIFDKPTVTLGFDGHQRLPWHKSIARLETLSHFKHVLETGSVPVVRSFEELFSRLKDYLDRPELDREKRKVLVSRMCYRADGQSAKRLVDFLLSKLNANK